MSRSEYMRIPLSHIPMAIQQHYNLEAISQNKDVYVDIMRGM
jgi:hypothetical protein